MSLIIQCFGDILIPSSVFFECKWPFHYKGVWLVNDSILDCIDNLIQSYDLHEYKDTDELLTSLKCSVQNPLMYAYKHYYDQLENSCIMIKMTGSYLEDFKSAAEIAEQQYGVSGFNQWNGTMSGYVWHHCENTKMENGHLYCKMELLTKESHSKPHKGGVHEYEQLFTVYKR